MPDGVSGGGGNPDTAHDSGSGNVTITDEAIANVPRINVFDDEDKNERYCQANKDLLKEAQKHPVGTEVSRVYDADMKPIVVRDDEGKIVREYGYTVGGMGSVKIDDPGVPYHAFHNHPSGETFSPEDVINITAKDNMLSLTAIGNNSKLFTISKTDNADNFAYSDFLNDKITEKRFFDGKFTYLDIKEFNVEELPEKLRIPIQNELKIFCKECIEGGKSYGFNYFEF